MSGTRKLPSLLPPGRSSERVTLASLAWGWPIQLRGGVSHPTGRKPKGEPRAPPLFLVFLPFLASAGVSFPGGIMILIAAFVTPPFLGLLDPASFDFSQ